MTSPLSKIGKKLKGAAGPRYLIVLALLVAAALVVRLFRAAPEPEVVSFTALVELAKSGRAAEVSVQGERFTLKKQGGGEATSVVGDAEARHDLVVRFAEAGVPVHFESGAQPGVPSGLVAALPVVVLACAGIGFAAVMRRRGRSHFVAFRLDDAHPVKFDDVAGMDEVKDALTETVEFLKDPKRFGRLGGRAPRGVLLTGEPGTGKTLLARATANEAGVPFLSASGSSFQEMFVGVGAARVRSLFAEARRLAPCMVFIDEIDAVGRSRARGGDSATADHDQTLNQLLVEMDGFDHTTGIVVIASTNRPDVLDPALLRPGRFDRQLVVPLPDLRGRRDILGVHARPLSLTDDVDLGQVARSTPGFSGADLANLLNEAAILAAREGAEAVEIGHIERARDRVMMGIERKGVLIDPEERHATAVHEAGHVAVGLAAANCDPVHKVSILPRGRALGVTHSLPERDRLMYRKEYLEDQICMMMGGRAAEMIILGTMTAGAADDIERATSLARKMVAELGMSELGPVALSDPRTQRSPALLDRIEDATHKLVERQLERACAMVAERREGIAKLVERLLELETLDEAQILACFPDDAARRTRAA